MRLRAFATLCIAVLLLMPTVDAAVVMDSIAFDAATDGGNNGGASSSRTFSHTTSGSNRILFVGVKGGLVTDGDIITGATYNGVSMTLVGSRTPGAGGTDGNRWVYLFVLSNPASGANNVVVSASGTVYILPGAVSYTGANQSDTMDSSAVGSVGGSTQTLTLSTTVVAANCWLVSVMGGGQPGGAPPTAGTGTTRRTYEGSFGVWAMFDSDGTVSTGSQALESSYTTSVSGLNGVIASFAPASAGSSFPAAIINGSIRCCEFLFSPPQERR